MSDYYLTQLQEQRDSLQRELSAAQQRIDDLGREALKTAARLRATETERDLLRGMAERIPETHMQFGVISPDGSVEMQPCADWCWACKLDAAKARAEQAEAELAALRQRYDDEHATAVARAQETDRVRHELAAAQQRVQELSAGCGQLSAAVTHWRDREAGAEARIAAVRALHERRTTLYSDRCSECFNRDYPEPWPCPTIAALDGPAEQPAAPPQLSPASIAAPEPVRLPMWIVMTERTRAEQQTAPANRPVFCATASAEEIAGHPDTLAAWLADMREHRAVYGVTPEWLGRIEHEGFPVVADDSLPLGEFHLRPRPKPEEPPTLDVIPCRCGHEEVEHAETVCRACVFAGRRALSQHGYIAADGPS